MVRSAKLPPRSRCAWITRDKCPRDRRRLHRWHERRRRGRPDLRARGVTLAPWIRHPGMPSPVSRPPAGQAAVLASNFANLLDRIGPVADTSAVPSTASIVQTRVERGGERLWTLADFPACSPAAVTQALSRLTRAGALERLTRGLYYRSRPTPFGKSLPNPGTLLRHTARSTGAAPLFPAGLTAASHLGFSTQTPARRELATPAASVPRALLGADVVVHTRRPATWAALTASDGALLDFLRSGGRDSELSPKETARKTLTWLAEPGRFARLARAAATEPPRVRAMLGALGEQLGHHSGAVRKLRASLCPLSAYDFGVFTAMPSARAWQARTIRV